VAALIVISASGTGEVSAEASEEFREAPQGKAGAVSPEDPLETLAMGQRFGIAVVNFFIRTISQVDGDRCPCFPTCSDYARRAIRKHGLLIGFVMTFDRLMHEADEIHRVPRIPIFGVPRYYDPVENNDFWWYRPEGSTSMVHSTIKRGP